MSVLIKGGRIVTAADDYVGDIFFDGGYGREPIPLLEQFANEIAGKEKTVIPGDAIAIDFKSGMIAWRGEKFAFPALGSVPQSLVIAQGVENLVAKRLGLV